MFPNALDYGPIKYDIKLTGTKLVETTWQPDTNSGGGGWTYTCNNTPPCSGASVTLATDVDPSHVLFTYYALGVNTVSDPTGNLSASPAMTQAVTGAGGTDQIDSVKIDLWLDPNGAGGSTAVEDTTTVHLINVDYAN